MTIYKFSPLAVLLATTAPALADMTAQDAWDMMQSYGEDAGLQMTIGNTQETANGLTVSNLRYSMDIPEVAMVFQVDQIVFEELGDGSVRTTTSEIPFAMTMEAEGEAVEILGRFALPGGHSIISGDPGDTATIFEYPTMTFTLDSFVVDGESIPIEATARGTDINGFMSITDSDVEGELTQQSTQYIMSKLTVDVSVEIPEEEGGGQAQVNAQFNDLDLLGFGSIAPMNGSGLPEGMVSHSKMNRGGSAISFGFDGPDGQVNVEFSDESGSLLANLEDGSIDYESKANATRISVSGSAIPFPPIEVGIASTSFGLTAPIQPSPDDRDFGMSIDLSGLVISDFLWSMLDPFNNLPHDPASISIAVSGTGKLSVDVFDPAFQPETMTAAPGSLSSFTVENFLLSAVGAEITAKGSAENVEENPLALPKMVGALDITGRGIQGLMENLGGMVILPVQSAAMGNMMLGMFAVPGSEPDTFTSRIEMSEDGGILANGQRLR